MSSFRMSHRRSPYPTGKWFSLSGDGSCVHIFACNESTDFDAHIRVFRVGGSTALNGELICHFGKLDAMEDCGSSIKVSYPSDYFATTAGTKYYILLEGSVQGDFAIKISCASNWFCT